MVAFCKSTEGTLPDKDKFQDSIVSFQSTNFGMAVNFMVIKERRLESVLEANLVADFIVFIVSDCHGCDAWAEQCQSALRAQGMPAFFPLLQCKSNDDAMEAEALNGAHASMPSGIDLKKLGSLKKEWADYFGKNYPDSHQIYCLSVKPDMTELERVLCQHEPKEIHWRSVRGSLLVQDASYDRQEKVLRLGGHIRGQPFLLNRKVHISGVGLSKDFELARVEIIQKTMTKEGPSYEKIMLDAALSVNELQDTFELNRDSTMMDAEYADSAEEMDDDLDDDSDDDNVSDADMDVESIEDISDNGESLDLNDAPVPFDKRVSFEEACRSNSGSSDEDSEAEDAYVETERCSFPDEVDYPIDAKARELFSEYRALKNFRHGTWDVNENLPSEYAHLALFQNLKLSSKIALNEPNEQQVGLEVGQYVNLYINNFPEDTADTLLQTIKYKPLSVFGLLKHEEKISVIHFSASRPHVASSKNTMIESFDSFSLYCGFRKYFLVKPIFSEASDGRLHKFIRVLDPEERTTVIASIYGHVMFGQPPALLLRTDDTVSTDWEESMSLISTGSLEAIDPMRLIIKRITLVGNPFKIHRNSATVRDMFFNAEDVKYFKPVTLMTSSKNKHRKGGKVIRGHIKESLGTHGYMKCVFDKPLQQSDAVLLHLYKRIFPAWTN